MNPKLTHEQPPTTEDSYPAHVQRTTEIDYQGELPEILATLVDDLNHETVRSVTLTFLPGIFPYGRGWRATVVEGGFVATDKPRSVIEADVRERQRRASYDSEPF